MNKIKNITKIQMINNKNLDTNDFYQPENLDKLTAPIINENYINTIKNCILLSFQNPKQFKKNLISDLKNTLADFFNISKDNIDDTIFNIPQFSTNNIKTLNTNLKEKLLETLPYDFFNELSYNEYINSNITKELNKIDQKDYSELYNKKFTEFYNRYKSEGRTNAKYEAEYFAEAYIKSDINARKSMIKSNYSNKIDIKNILEKCYNKIIEEYKKEQEEENQAKEKLGTIFQN